MHWIIGYVIFGVVINLFYFRFQLKRNKQLVLADIYWSLLFMIVSPVVLFFILGQIKDFVLFKKND